MKSQQEIQKLETYYKQTLHGPVRTEQRIDEEYYRDKFKVKQLEEVIPISRTGRANRLIEGPVQQISSAQVQVHVTPKKATKASNEEAIKVSKILNDTWLPQMLRSNPHPIREWVKNDFLRGEAWYYLLHNDRWIIEPIDQQGIPVSLFVPDPMNVFASPKEDWNGIPEHVILSYEKLAWIVGVTYKDWKNPDKKEMGDPVTWIEYWDSDQHYAEAGGQVVFDKPNVYGFPPFVHKISPFGKVSPEGKLQDQIVGRLRPERDLLMRECALTSSHDAAWHQFALHEIDVQSTDPQQEVPKDFVENYTRQWGGIHVIPSWIKVTRTVDTAPTPDSLRYLMALSADIEGRIPGVLLGMAAGETGRLQDILLSTAAQQYGGVIDGLQDALGTALTMAVRQCDKLPMIDLGVKNIAERFDIKVTLKPSNPLEEGRKSAEGSRLLLQGEISPITNLVRYKGYTEDEAYEELTNVLAWKAVLSPINAQIIGQRIAEQAGLLQEYMSAQEQAELAGKQQQSLMETSPTQQQRVMGERQTETGQEELDFFGSSPYSGRQPPKSYTRGK